MREEEGAKHEWNQRQRAPIFALLNAVRTFTRNSLLLKCVWPHRQRDRPMAWSRDYARDYERNIILCNLCKEMPETHVKQASFFSNREINFRIKELVSRRHNIGFKLHFTTNERQCGERAKIRCKVFSMRCRHFMEQYPIAFLLSKNILSFCCLFPFLSECLDKHNRHLEEFSLLAVAHCTRYRLFESAAFAAEQTAHTFSPATPRSRLFSVKAVL